MREEMKGSVEIVWAEEALTLLPQRALYWERLSTLFITDPHFGKGATFRSAGMALPQGSTKNDLQRLGDVLTTTGAERLVVLGDFFHTKASQSAKVLASLAAWRNRYENLAVTLIRGNHDRHAGAPPAALQIETVADGLSLPPFVCYHEPLAVDTDHNDKSQAYRLCGHLHPVFTLRDRDGSSMRQPVFHFSAYQAILPAFGRFTGGYPVQKGEGDRLFLSGDERVMEI